MEQVKWSEKVTNEEVLELIGEKKTLINKILCRKADWTSHILRRNCHFHDAIEGQMTKVKVVGRRRRTQLPDEKAEGKKIQSKHRKWRINCYYMKLN